jgi:hypothetical protein
MAITLSAMDEQAAAFWFVINPVGLPRTESGRRDFLIGANALSIADRLVHARLRLSESISPGSGCSIHGVNAARYLNMINGIHHHALSGSSPDNGALIGCFNWYFDARRNIPAEKVQATGVYPNTITVVPSGTTDHKKTGAGHLSGMLLQRQNHWSRLRHKLTFGTLTLQFRATA